MPTYEIKWTREQWFSVQVEAADPEQAEAKFWEGDYENEQMFGSEIQDNVETNLIGDN
jgi:hypothetical protein